MHLMPRKPVPALEFDLVGGGRWSLAAQKPQNFTMVVFYRGLHCPICHRYTSELNGMIADFDKRGVSTVITSTDSMERAAEMARLDRGAAARVRRSLARIETAFRDGLAAARARGELPPGSDPAALARFLTAGIQGLRLVGKANPDRAALNDIAKTMLRCLT